MTSYEVVYTRFAQKITDYDLSALSEEDLAATLFGYLISAISKFKKCKSDLSDRNDENLEFNVDLLDSEIEILALMMVVEWIEPQLNSSLITNQFFGGKDEKFFSQSNQLEKLMLLKETTARTARKLIRNYTYLNNDYLSEE